MPQYHILLKTFARFDIGASKFESRWPSNIESMCDPDLILDAPLSNLAKSMPDSILGYLRLYLDGHLKLKLGAR